ncbi:Adenosinetriphosphatase protein [Dioscorea alata]|uniref:Adenosinetriphosphatase protein n=1 Tax=Dioscorea alata TaxID=55571 RepID=A0ACB7VKP9_DIOAL|nr:Adenosinetriphosphatase protein [Dioscorea alata]
MSKYYGESERLLGTVFSLANEMSTGAIVFLDEVDSFAVARDDEMHEATRRLLSVILRQIDGFEQDKNVVVIAATNRKNDLDPALISRFDSMITFDLPDQQTREKIVAQYAKHLARSDLAKIALATEKKGYKRCMPTSRKTLGSKVNKKPSAKRYRRYKPSSYRRVYQMC